MFQWLIKKYRNKKYMKDIILLFERFKQKMNEQKFWRPKILASKQYFDKTNQSYQILKYLKSIPSLKNGFLG